MSDTHLLVLATGGTIAGVAGSALRHDYRPGQIGIADYLEQVGELGLDARLVGRQVANIGSEDIDAAVWNALLIEGGRRLAPLMERYDEIAGWAVGGLIAAIVAFYIYRVATWTPREKPNAEPPAA